MYAKFFGFKEKPFKLVPNPDYLYLSRSHEEALAHLTYAVSEGDGFVEITGEIGTGKTTLCRAFLENLDKNTEVAFIFNPNLDAIQLLKTINDEFGINSKADNTKDLIDTLNAFLMKKKGEDKKVILLIDEAQNLSLNVLEQLRLLSNLETTRDKLLQIILVGQPELSDLLDTRELRQLRQRITLSCHLRPFEVKEIQAYIRHRIHIASRKTGVKFTKGAFRAINAYSGGIPRLINIVCDRALLTAFGLDQKKINTATIRTAIRELSGVGNIRRFNIIHTRKIFYLFSAVLLVSIIAIFSFPENLNIPGSLKMFESLDIKRKQSENKQLPVVSSPSSSPTSSPFEQDVNAKPPSSDHSSKSTDSILQNKSQNDVQVPLHEPTEETLLNMEDTSESEDISILALESLNIKPSKIDNNIKPNLDGTPKPSKLSLSISDIWPEALNEESTKNNDTPDQEPEDFSEPPNMPANLPIKTDENSTDLLPKETKASPAKGLANYLEKINISGSRHGALKVAMDMWGEESFIKSYLADIANDQDFFKLAVRQNGFLIQRVENGLDLIRKLKLPAVLEFNLPGVMSPVYLAVCRIDNHSIILKSKPGDNGLTVTDTEVNQYYSGVAYIPWKNFYGYKGIIPVDAGEAGIITLKMHIRDIGFEDIDITPDYDKKTEETIKNIQKKYDLKNDGVVGPLTKIVLYNEDKTLNIPYITD